MDPAWVVADLSLGAWQGHQVASEFCAQLGLMAPRRVLPRMGTPVPPNTTPTTVEGIMNGPPAYADLIGAWIDAEGGGDRTILGALDLATRVVVAVGEGPPRVFLVLVPRFGLPWEIENALFLRFLVQGLRRSGSRLVIVCTDREGLTVPGDWIVNWLNAPEPAIPAGLEGFLGLVPGVIEPDMAAAIQAAAPGSRVNALPLADGRLLVAPESRRRPRDVSRVEYDRLALVARSFGWVHAYAQCFGNNLYVHPLLLCREAWERFAEGGCGIALRLMERAIMCARLPPEQGFLQAQAQAMRIALHRFKEAAACADPSPVLPQTLRGFLLQAKGWGLVLTEQSACAEPYLREARHLLEPYGQTREYLYLLNISALGRLKSGDVEGALKLERRIEADAGGQARRDWQLEYVNSINLARLHRRRGDFDAAEHYYQQAFATTLGARSDSDAIYVNVCWARLHADRGWLARAVSDWLRAGLHWMSSNAPEALALRVVTAILGRPLSPDENLPEEVSSALLSLLFGSAKAAGLEAVVARLLDPALARLTPYTFIHADRLPEDAVPGAISSAVGGPGWSVLMASGVATAPYTGAHYHPFQSLLSEFLRMLSPADALTTSGSIIIDDRSGREIPGTPIELLETCVRLGVPKMVFGTQMVELGRELRCRLEMHSRAHLASAVDRVEYGRAGGSVTFKRYLAPHGLSAEEAQILAALGDQPSLAELWQRTRQIGPLDRVVRMVRSLEQSRVIELSLSEDACVEAGVNLPSSTN
ncbi:MAG TPA: tetratricopeptide repeat protein [Candidatus Tectomicrobia bacterium]|nr:tetratricopeptide repeat protein [Candidatus Tectomicrobia bacterium]